MISKRNKDWVISWSNLNVHWKYWERLGFSYCEKLRSTIKMKDSYDILDFGSGSGFIDFHLSGYVKSCHLVEASGALIEESKRINEQKTNIFYLYNTDNEILKNYLASHEFDIVIINSVIQYLSKDDFLAILKILSPGLKKNGRIIISDILCNKSQLFKDTWDTFLFFLKWLNCIEFAKYMFFEIKRIAVKGKLDLTVYKKEELIEMLSSEFQLKWIENVSHSSSRLCVILQNK